MIGHPDTDSTSKLPLNARTARIASGGGLAACSRGKPEKVKVSGETGTPDELDIVERRAGEGHPSRTRS